MAVACRNDLRHTRVLAACRACCLAMRVVHGLDDAAGHSASPAVGVRASPRDMGSHNITACRRQACAPIFFCVRDRFREGQSQPVGNTGHTGARVASFGQPGRKRAWPTPGRAQRAEADIQIPNRWESGGSQPGGPRELSWTPERSADTIGPATPRAGTVRVFDGKRSRPTGRWSQFRFE